MEETVVKNRMSVTVETVCVPMGAVGVKLVQISRLHATGSSFSHQGVRAEGR